MPVRSQQLVQRHVRAGGGDDLGTRVELRQRGLDGEGVVAGHEVALVEDDEVGELDLRDEELRDAPVAVRVGRLAARFTIAESLQEIGGRREVAVERGGVDDGDARVEARDLLQGGRTPQGFDRGGELSGLPRVHVSRIVGRARHVDPESLGNLHGLRHPGGFHDDGVELALGGEVRDGLDEVGAQRAAHATVLQLHQARFVGIERARVPHQGAVDVERRDVVHDDRDAEVPGVLHDALEQRGLTGAEEAGEEGDGDRGLHDHVRRVR